MYQYTAPVFLLMYACVGTVQAQNASAPAVDPDTPQEAAGTPEEAPELNATVPADTPDSNATAPADTPEYLNVTTPEESPEEEAPDANDTSPDANATAPADFTPDANDSTPYLNDTTPEANDTTPIETNSSTPEAPRENGTTPEAPEAPRENGTTPEAPEAPRENGTTPEANNGTTPKEGGATPQDTTNGTTPVDGTTPVPVDVPAPPGITVWCGSDLACRTLGDTGATCDTTNFQCNCSTGFGPLVDNNVTAYLCAREGANAAEQVVNIVISLVFNIACETFDQAAHGDSFTLLIASALGGSVRSVQFRCGSLVVTSEVHGVNAISLATTDVASAVNNELSTNTQFSSLSNAVGTVSSATTAVGGSSCTVANAASTFVLNGVCVPVSCQSGYTLRNDACVISTATAVVNVTATAVVRDSSDDDLSASQIAGIVVGVVAAVGLIIAVVFFLMSKNTSAGVPLGDPEAHDPSHEPVHDGEGV